MYRYDFPKVKLFLSYFFHLGNLSAKNRKYEGGQNPEQALKGSLNFIRLLWVVLLLPQERLNRPGR